MRFGFRMTQMQPICECSAKSEMLIGLIVKFFCVGKIFPMPWALFVALKYTGWLFFPFKAFFQWIFSWNRKKRNKFIVGLVQFIERKLLCLLIFLHFRSMFPAIDPFVELTVHLKKDFIES